MKKWMILAMFFFWSSSAMDNIPNINPIKTNQEETFSSRSKKFISTLAPYFTYKKNFVGVQLSIIAAYEILSYLSHFDSSSNKDKRIEIIHMNSSESLSLILKKMNFDKLTYLILSSAAGNTAGLSSIGSANLITMNHEFYNSSSEDEKTFVIGHEITHAKNYHPEKRSFAALGILLGTSSALLAYDKVAQVLFEKAEKILKLDEKSYCSRILNFLKTSNHAIATAPLVHWFISKYFYYKFSQSLEIEADRESAQLLDCAQGGISFFEKAIAKDAPTISGSWFSYLNPFTSLKLINYTFGFLDHPSDQERIVLLKKYN